MKLLLAQHQSSFNFSLLLCACSISTLFVSNMSTGVDAIKDNRSSDGLALIAFKNGVTVDPLGVLSSWNDTLHICEWRGVICSGRERGRVTVLDLDSQGLVGSISPHIGNLSFLEDLILRNNSLSGVIPQQIGRLLRLKRLSLSNNHLGGEIPVNISRFSNLIHLNISHNNLVGRIPSGLGYLSNLRMMSLYDNKLSGEIPASLGNLSSSSFTRLGLSVNNLEGRIPDTLSQLTNLNYLNLGFNRLSGIVPSSLYNISSSLETFQLMNNQLHGSIPFDIGFTLPNLSYFSVANNNFTGTIPSSISNMSRLELLQMSGNNFVGLVPRNLGNLKSLQILSFAENKLGSGESNDLSFLDSLVNCTNLMALILSGNNFGGVLPSSVANLTTNLDYIYFGRNQIVGSIPAGIQNLVGLTILNLGSNQLTGSIPPGIGLLQNLGLLSFSYNHLFGSIPSSFGNLTRLSKLYLNNNNLTGIVPPSLGSCKSLELLKLHTNRLSGSIPKQLFQLPSLSRVLDLSKNSFTGTLPVEVGELKNLGVLDLSFNKISGEIPSAIGGCLILTYLNFRSNLFQGTIPSTITSLKGLETLLLSNNNFSGEIPKDLGNLKFLQQLNLSFNNLQGEVPQEGVFTNLSALSITGNDRLCGGVPELKLRNCPKPLNSATKRKAKNIKVVIIIINVVVVLLITLVVFYLTLCLRKKSKTKLSSKDLNVDKRFKGVSYNELIKATNGFNDSTNLLGVGSFGSVYKGFLQQDESKPVAVKVLHLQQRGATKSFMTECDALSKVRHRNLLKIITCCSSTDFHGNPFKALVFQFMTNGSLENWLHPTVSHTNNGDQLHEKNLDLERRLGIAVDVASALNYLHHESPSTMVHCDVKPSNVLLDDDLTAHVGDFGLAKFLSDPSSTSTELDAHDASSVVLKGSIGYVSPEYGMGCEVSTQGDVYSYGILLLEMFTGKRPTDDMFTDGLNIHNFCQMHELPGRIEEVLDPGLLFELRQYHNDTKITNYNMLRNERRNIARDTMKQILASMIQIGVKCSSELPSNRSSMNEVLVQVEAVRNQFLGVTL